MASRQNCKLNSIYCLRCTIGDLYRIVHFSASETMEDIVQAKFTHFENDDPDYPNMDGLTNQHVFVAPRPTKASLGNAAVAKERREKFNAAVRGIMLSYLCFPGADCNILFSGGGGEAAQRIAQGKIYYEKVSKYTC